MTTHALAANPLTLRPTRDSSPQPVGTPPREQAAGDAGASLRLATMPSTNLRAIESAYIRCAGVISRALMVRLGGDAAATDDLMQQLWIAAQTNATGVEEAQLEFWLRGVARNLLNTHLRRLDARSRNLPTVDAALAGELAAGLERGPLGDDFLARREVLDQLLLAITDLSSDDFEILHQFYFRSRSHADIALALGLSERAVEARLYRARSALRERLASPEQTDGRATQA